MHGAVVSRTQSRGLFICLHPGCTSDNSNKSELTEGREENENPRRTESVNHGSCFRSIQTRQALNHSRDGELAPDLSGNDKTLIVHWPATAIHCRPKMHSNCLHYGAGTSGDRD